MKNFLVCSAALALLAVALGAFGAHALKDTLAAAGRTDVWETAVFYHLVHAVAAWALGHGSKDLSVWHRRAGWLWITGILLFSGSLYALSLGGPKVLGPVTPLGGLALIAGWVCIIVATLRTPPQAD